MGERPMRGRNHLGAAYFSLLTIDLASDVAYLKSQGVRFLSEPYGVPGNRFVFFRDPDGVLFKLEEPRRRTAMRRRRCISSRCRMWRSTWST